MAQEVPNMENRGLSPLAWLGIALVVAIVLMAVFGTLNLSTYGGYYGMMGSGSWGWGILMMAVPGVILLVILITVLAGLSERPAGGPYPVAASSRPGTALELLDARYARGEISQDDYRKTRDDLTQGPRHA